MQTYAVVGVVYLQFPSQVYLSSTYVAGSGFTVSLFHFQPKKGTLVLL